MEAVACPDLFTSRASRPSSETDQAAAKVVEADEPTGVEVESEDTEDNFEMENQLNSFEIPEERNLLYSLVFSALPLIF